MESLLLARIAFLVWCTGAASAQSATTPSFTSRAVGPRHFICNGEEPFWRVELDGNSARVRRLTGAGDLERSFSGSFRTFDFLEPAWYSWRGQNAAAETLVAVIRKEPCRSTMADGPALAYRALISFPDGSAQTGCCRSGADADAAQTPVADAARKPPEDWSRLLPDLMPAIRKCVVSAGFDVARIPKAWPMNRGLAAVRLEDAKGREYDCVVEQTGTSIVRMDPVRPNSPPLPGSGNPVFIPNPEQPPLIGCGRLERVLDPKSGMLEGWLKYRAGRRL